MNMMNIVSGTPVWVWVLLGVLVSRGMKALKGGTAPLSKLAVVPLAFAAWGVLHLLSDRASGLDAWMMWAAGALLGAGIGAMLAKRSGLSVNRAARTITLPGSAVPLVLIVVTFATKFWLGYELATTHVAVDAGFVVLSALVSGVTAGIFTGRFLIYWLALRQTAPVAFEGA
jgi:hypothetical protein